MSEKQMEEARAEWAIQQPLRDVARKARKLVYPVPYNQQEAYYKTINEVQNKLKGSLSPAMPVIAIQNVTTLAMKEGL